MAYTNHLFALPLPKGWEDTTIHTIRGPFLAGVQHNLIITIDSTVPPQMDLITWVYQLLGSSKEMLPGFEMLHEGEKILGSGEQAYEVTYKYWPSDESPLFQKQLFILLGTQGYLFTSSYSKKTLRTIAPQVDAMIEQFTLFSDEEWS